MLEYKSGRIAAKLNKGEKLIVKDISFSIGDGQTMALIGRTGAGKTTIASSLMGLMAENIVAEGNSLILDGKELSFDERRRLLGRDIVYIPQSGHECLNKTRKIKDQFADSAGKSCWHDSEERLLSLVGFDNPERIMEMYPFELSGGMAQRVVIALAAGASPRIVIADEPTNGIDESFRDELLSLMKRVFPNACVIIITHDSLLAKACDMIVDLEKDSREPSLEPACVDPSCLESRCSVAKGKDINDILLKVSSVSKSFGKKQVLCNTGLEIKNNSIAGLLGKSGIGKSSLAKLITGLDIPDSGEIIFDGKALFDDKGNYDRKTGLAIQMVYQQPYAVLDPVQKIRAGLRELVKYHKLSETESVGIDEYIDSLAEKAGLSKDILNHLPTQISGGEAQRVAILKCLMLKPKLLILDEATSMLDENTQGSILKLIKTEMIKNGGSVLMISHDETLTKNICDYVFRLDDGIISPIDY